MESYFVYMLVVLWCSALCRGVLISPPPSNSSDAANLQVGFYSRTCPQAEDIVRAQVQKRFLIDNTITPALLRMLFHDSFVRGADASILLDSTPGHEAEKEALPNLTIRGFDLIDEVKEALESACPGVVSCADIIVMGVRDSVALAGGPKYDVPTGRLDGKVSIKEEALNLPSPAFPVEQSQESFREKGLDLEDMVALLGAHTVGVALCGFFNDRLFNFHGTGAADPTMNPQLVTRLSGVCPNPFFTESNADPPIALDQATVAIFDTKYYTEIIAGNGILEIDQEITADPTTVGFVQSFTSTANFFPAFVRSIIKMGNIEVKTGANPLGEVRRKCNLTNAGAAVGTPVKPAPAGDVSKTPPALKPAPAGQPPPVTKPAPAGHISKPPHTPTLKPAPGGHVTKPPTTPVAKPSPISTKPAPPGHVTKPPTTPVTKPSPISIKPAPAGHVSKPSPTTPSLPGDVSKPPPVTPARKPAPSGHDSKSPVSKPAPAGHVRQGPPATPAGKQAPPHHVSKPAPPGTPAVKPAPTGHVSEPPAATTPAPSGPVSRPPPLTPVVKPAPPGQSSSPSPHIPVAKPAPAGAHVSPPPVAPPQQGSTPQGTSPSLP